MQGVVRGQGMRLVSQVTTLVTHCTRLVTQVTSTGMPALVEQVMVVRRGSRLVRQNTTFVAGKLLVKQTSAPAALIMHCRTSVAGISLVKQKTTLVAGKTLVTQVSPLVRQTTTLVTMVSRFVKQRAKLVKQG